MASRARITATAVMIAATFAAAVAAPASATNTTRTANGHHKGTEISTVKTKLGRVVSDSKGRVMFRFMKDGHDKSVCHASCQEIWPPVTSMQKARAGSHIKAKHLGLTSKGQVTYYHHPLYFYVSDPKPGKTHGDGIKEFGAKWYVVSPHGKPVKPGSNTPAPPGNGTVDTGRVGSLTVLTTADGHALYELSSESDSPPTFTCTAVCTSVWPPLLATGTPSAGGKAKASKLGTVMRPDGTTQVTYNHHPLYSYSGDSKAGTDHGEGMYDPPGYWYVLSPSGAPQ